MVERAIITPANPHSLYAEHGYSPAILSGDFLFVSGQVGAQADGSPVEDIEGQIKKAFENLDGILKAAGCGFGDIVDVTTFHINPEQQFAAVLATRDAYFDGLPVPNWTAVGVTWLAGFQFEIKVIARVPGASNHG